MAITIDNVGQSTTASGSPLTVTLANFVIGGGTNRYLIVGVSFRSGGGGTSVSGITFGGGQSLSFIGSKTEIGDNRTIELWGLKAPITSTADIVVSFGGNQVAGSVVVGASSWSGVDQTTPLGSFVSDADSGFATGGPSDSVSTSATDIVVDVLVWSTGSTTTATKGTSQTQIYNAMQSTNEGGAGSYQAASGVSVTMSWSLSPNDLWAWGAVPLKASVPSPITAAAAGMVQAPPVVRGGADTMMVL